MNRKEIFKLKVLLLSCADSIYRILWKNVAGIDVPIRIGRTVVVSGDVVAAKREGVIFLFRHTWFRKW